MFVLQPRGVGWGLLRRVGQRWDGVVLAQEAATPGGQVTFGVGSRWLGLTRLHLALHASPAVGPLPGTSLQCLPSAGPWGESKASPAGALGSSAEVLGSLPSSNSTPHLGFPFDIFGF